MARADDSGALAAEEKATIQKNYLFGKFLQKTFNVVKNVSKDRDGYYSFAYSEADIPKERNLKFGQTDMRSIFIRSRRDDAYRATSGLKLNIFSGQHH